MDNNSIIEKLKELVKKGNVSRILVRKGDKILVDVPVNVGIIGGVAVLAMSKVLLIAGVLATVGFGCTVEVIKDDGQIVDVITEETGEKARAAAQSVVDEVKNTFRPEEAEAGRRAQGVIPSRKHKEAAALKRQLSYFIGKAGAAWL